MGIYLVKRGSNITKMDGVKYGPGDEITLDDTESQAMASSIEPMPHKRRERKFHGHGGEETGPVAADD